MLLRTSALAALLALTPALAAVDAQEPLALLLVVGHPHGPLPSDLPRAEALARLDAGAAPFVRAVAAAVAASGGEVRGAWSAAPAALVAVPARAAPLLAALPEVRAVADHESDTVGLLHPPQEDAPSGANTGGRRMLQAEDAWALGFRGEGVRLAVVGTGIDASHEAFRRADGSSRIVAWRDIVGGQPTPYDDQGHGTGMAASAAGSSVYVDPVHGPFQEAGVAPGADLLGVKFLDANGSGTWAGAIDALQWAFASGADITINGWGSGCTSAALGVMQAVRTLTDAGMVSVFTVGASGPGPSSIGAPACGEAAISVGGLAGPETIANFSSRGPCSDIELGGAPRVCPDLVAKAANVRTAAPRGGCPLCDGSGYRTGSSVSSAAAFVGGAVALIEQMKRTTTGVGWNTSAREEERMLKETARDLGPPGPDDAYGWGLPQVMPVYALLRASDEALVLSSFQPPPAVLRGGDVVTLSFTVRNLGGATATGLLEASLQRPDGSVETIASSPVSLSRFQEAVASRAFAAGAEPAGAYVFRARFAYSWTNATTGEIVDGVVAGEGAFEVRRVVLELSAPGWQARAPPLVPQDARFRVANAGNEPASTVEVRLTYPEHYVLLSPAPPDPTDPHSRYGSPAPDRVEQDANFGRTTLLFAVGSLAPGEEWTFETSLVPTRPGSHRFLLAAYGCDGGGHCHVKGLPLQQEIGLFP